jgi:triosephosphate isomerase
MAAVRRPIIFGNWKLNKTLAEAQELAVAVKHVAGALHFIDIGIAPGYTALWAVAQRVAESKVLLGAQNCFWEDFGPYTGEVSVPILADVGVEYIIVGHSERRQLFGEDDAMVSRKLQAVLRNGVNAIFCIGETLTEREAEQTFEVLKRQLVNGLDGVTEGMAKQLVVAYEPVWAIGTGKTATTAQAQEAHEFIRAHLTEAYGEVGEHVRVMYGGSVTPDNIQGLMEQPDVDGALVGGASLRAETFIDILKYKG